MGGISKRAVARWALTAALVVVAFFFLREASSFAVRKLTGRKPLNISCFAFRDIDRDGVYGVGDRPYAGLEVWIQKDGRRRPSGIISNDGGFANFTMARGMREHPVSSPGEYTVVAYPAPGFSVTTGNESQRVKFFAVDGSPSGLAIEETMSHVGIAPDLVITGKVDRSRVQSVRAKPSAGKAADVPLAADGSFSLDAVPSEWTVTFTLEDGTETTRETTVRSYPVVVSAPSSTGQDPSPIGGAAQSVGFDDVTSSDTLYELPFGYHGLDWKNWIATHQKLYGADGYINANTSGEYIAYNSSGQTATVSSPKPFDFAGAIVGVAWEKASGGDVVFQGWRGDELAYEDRLRVTPAGPVDFDAEYLGITKLVCFHEQFWQVVIDDFGFRTPD